MELSEAIFYRKSCRAYQKGPLDMQIQSLLQDEIQRLNHQSGLHFELIVNDRIAFSNFFKTYGFFKNVNHYVICKANPSIPFWKELMGYYGELLVLYATTLGLGTCFVGGTFDKKYIGELCPKEESVGFVIAIGTPLDSRFFLTKGSIDVTHRKSKPLASFLESREKVPEWIIKSLPALAYAPSALNRQGVKLHFNQGELTISGGTNDQYDPYDLGIAKANFEIFADRGCFEHGNPSKFLLK